MWDLIVSVPVHCLSFYYVLFYLSVVSLFCSCSETQEMNPGRFGSAASA